jgi:hypothetical protein
MSQIIKLDIYINLIRYLYKCIRYLNMRLTYSYRCKQKNSKREEASHETKSCKRKNNDSKNRDEEKNSQNKNM